MHMALDEFGQEIELSLGGDSVVLVQEISTGLREELAASIRLYPNPAREQLYLEWEQLQVEEILLLDLQGRILSKESNPLPRQAMKLDGIPAGLYLVQLKTQQGIWTEKVVILRE